MMIKWFDGFMMAWRRFLLVPPPFERENDEAKTEMMACFPLIGLLLGFIEVLAALVSMRFSLALFSFILTALPLLLTGFIHLSGFLSVSSALISFRDPEERRAALKDDRSTNISVILTVLSVLSVFSVYFSSGEVHTVNLLFLPVSARALTYFACAFFPALDEGGRRMPRSFAATVFCALILAVSITVPVLKAGAAGLCCLVSAVVFAVSLVLSSRCFQGITREVTGFSVFLAELSGIFFAAVV